MHFDKHFTVDEANALIPRFREIFTQIHELIVQARGREPMVRPGVIPHGGRTNGNHAKAVHEREEILKRINELVTEITDAGVVIQDITRGLIDFPAVIEGDEVFLCYELEDGERILYYHGLDAGYAGRKELPDAI
ncbi:MAG: DUF2203 family protein [bacterium]|nr:DUF2203 family protein [bacterium]